MSSISSSSSPPPPCPAAENLAEAISFKSKKKIPSTVTYLHPQQPQPQPFPSPQQQQQKNPGSNQNPKSISVDPVKYTTWGPKTVFYAVTAGKETKKKHHISGSKSKTKSKGAEAEGGEMKFEKWTLSGSEEVQTTETTEILGLDAGGGVKRTWVLTSKVVVVGVGKGVDAKDVVVESEGE